MTCTYCSTSHYFRYSLDRTTVVAYPTLPSTKSCSRYVWHRAYTRSIGYASLHLYFSKIKSNTLWATRHKKSRGRAPLASTRTECLRSTSSSSYLQCYNPVYNFCSLIALVLPTAFQPGMNARDQSTKIGYDHIYGGVKERCDWVSRRGPLQHHITSHSWLL